MDAWIDMLDAWVEKGVAPPPSKFNWMEMGDLNKDGVNENPAIQLPEVACPLGVYHTFAPPRGGAGNTGFTPFDGKGLEPFDRRGRIGDGLFHYEGYTDMNRNGTRDFKETATQAWRRLGLLKPNEKFTRDQYVSCIDKEAEKLSVDRFLLPKAVAIYKEKARTDPLPMQ